MSTYYFLPTRNVFGQGAAREAGELMKSLGGRKTMIVTDRFLGQNGMAQQIQDILTQSGVDSVIFSGAEPNPTDKNVAAGVAEFQKNGCDSILSLGGGSSHDCAKGIGMVAANGGTIHEYEGIDKSKNPLMPLMAVNTTAGTASEITRFCIITDTTRKVKMAIVDWRITPQIAINDPELMKGMPPALTAATGMDALTHAIEAYVSTAGSMFTDANALHAIREIVEWLPKSYQGDKEARQHMHEAQCIAGIAFSSGLLGIVHSMAHKTGAAFTGDHIIHGCANAMYLGKVIQFNAKDARAKSRYAYIAKEVLHLAGETEDELVAALVQEIRDLNDKLDIPQGIKNYGKGGVKADESIIDYAEFEEKKSRIAVDAIGDACTGSNPRQPTPEEMEKLLECVYNDVDVDF